MVYCGFVRCYYTDTVDEQANASKKKKVVNDDRFERVGFN